jgi:hypothetical protein
MSTSVRVPSLFYLLLGCSVVFALYGGWCVGSHAFRVGGAFIVLALASAIVGTLRRGQAPQPALDGDTVPMDMDILFAETIWIDPVAFDIESDTTRETQAPARRSRRSTWAAVDELSR